MSMMDDSTTITAINDVPTLFQQGYVSASNYSTTTFSYGWNEEDVKVEVDPEKIANLDEVKEEVLKKIVDDPRLDDDYKIILSYLREHLEKLMDSPDNLLTHLIEDNKDLRKRIEVLENEVKSLKK